MCYGIVYIIVYIVCFLCVFCFRYFSALCSFAVCACTGVVILHNVLLRGVWGSFDRGFDKVSNLYLYISVLLHCCYNSYIHMSNNLYTCAFTLELNLFVLPAWNL